MELHMCVSEGDVAVPYQLEPLTFDHPKEVREKAHTNKGQLEKEFENIIFPSLFVNAHCSLVLGPSLNQALIMSLLALLHWEAPAFQRRESGCMAFLLKESRGKCVTQGVWCSLTITRDNFEQL